MNYQQHDEELWKIAKKRASFKWSFSIYVFVNAFLIGVWYFSSGPYSYFWPVWTMLGWGIGLLFQYLNAYQKHDFITQQEYQKLKDQQNNQL
jgi:hypothetical protein